MHASGARGAAPPAPPCSAALFLVWGAQVPQQWFSPGATVHEERESMRDSARDSARDSQGGVRGGELPASPDVPPSHALQLGARSGAAPTMVVDLTAPRPAPLGGSPRSSAKVVPAVR